jgi:LysR family glycine cleavage system transcriptional activator
LTDKLRPGKPYDERPAGAALAPKWAAWFQQLGVGVTARKESVRFADTNMTIEAALLGHGVALARSGHVETEINDGSLVRLFAVPFASPVAYYFVCPKGIESQPHIISFRAWLLAQSGKAQQGYRKAIITIAPICMRICSSPVEETLLSS